MATNCNIKESSEAWNYGVETFGKYYNGNNPTSSFRKTIKDIKAKFPDVNFDPKSFIEPLLESMKKSGHIDEDYQFYKPEKTLTEQQVKNKLSEEKKTNIIKAADKLRDLDENQKSKVLKNLYHTFDQQGILTEEHIQNAYADALGMPAMNEETKGAIQDVSNQFKKLQDIQSNIDKKAQELDNLIKEGKLTDEESKKLGMEIYDLGKQEQAQKFIVGRAQNKLSQSIKEKQFSELSLVDFQVMNLLSPATLFANITGMAFDLPLRYSRRAISSLMNIVADSYKNKKIDTRSWASSTKGTAMQIPSAWKKFKEALLFNNTDFGKEIPRYDNINAVTAFKAMMDSKSLKEGAGKFIPFFFRIHPDIIKRALAGPDQFVHSLIFGGELNRIADQKGLKGAERELFLVRPDEKSIEAAMALADEATLRTENFASKHLSYSPMKDYERLVEKGRNKYYARALVFLKYFSIKNIAPFTKTPLNLISLAARYTVPGYELARTAVLAHAEQDGSTRRQIIRDGIGTAIVGFAIQRMAFQLIVSGAISSGFGDDDEKTREGVEKQLGGQNRVNYSALLRLMSGGSAEHKDGDETIELRSLGILGMVLGAHAHAFNKYSEKEQEEQFDITNTLNTFPKELKATLISALDNSFMSGTNTLIDALKSDEDYKTEKYTNQAVLNLLTGIAPSTYQKASTSLAENIKQTYDKDKTMSENLADSFGYKFLFSGGKDMKNKYYSLSEEEGNHIKKRDYMYFDDILGRILHSEFSVFKTKDVENSTLSKLYNSAKEVDKKERSKMYPSSISQKDPITLDLDEGSVKVKLNNEQYDYLVQKASFYRMLAATPYINSEDFDKNSYDDRAKTLARFYEDGLSAAKKALVDRYFGSFDVQKHTEEDKEIVSENIEKYSTELPND